jgi:hypothetical protein
MLVIGSRAPDAARRERALVLWLCIGLSEKHALAKAGVLTLFGPMHYAARISLKN